MRKFLGRTSALLGVITIFSKAVLSEVSNPERKPISAHWQVIASSNVIVRAKVSNKTIIPFETLKGIRVQRIELENSEGMERIPPSENNEVIVFLVRIHNDRTNGYYLTESSPPSILPSSEMQLQLIRKEILNQEVINDNFSELSVAKPDKFDKEVKQLLNKLVDSETQDESWTKLVNLGSDAAPAFIRCMDDKRKIAPADYSSSSRTRKSAYDDHFHYSPQVVQDAVSILLNQSTRTGFYTTINGGTAEERKLDLAGWRVWLYYGQK
ncbi:MAG: hypothetical protein SFY67_06700 [Candidatus Melainabacteria bacterium]|nr:hypothetical protein [Candidatus Melainabacteria bacterium]